MKILLVHKFFHLTGGAEVFFFETARILEEMGHEVAFFSTIDERNLKSKYSQYFVQPPQYRSGNIVSRIAGIQSIIYSRQAKQRIKLLIRDFKPDIVHVFAMFTHISPSILDGCREEGVPVVLTCNDYKHICPNYKMFHHGRICEECKGGRFYRSVVNRCCHDSFSFSVASSIESYCHHWLNILRRNVNTFLFSSDFMAQKTADFWIGKDFSWRKLINPFNSQKYQISHEYGNYILFFGRFADEKGIETLLDAMNLVPEANLIIVGDGPLDDELKNRAKNIGLCNVEFVGQKWGDDLDKLLRQTRFVVVPSMWHENFPYVIFQSFAVGKAVIGSNRGGIPELIQHGEFGLIYPAQNSTALADCIRELWNNPALAIKMGTQAKKYADAEFNDQKFYETIMDIYNEVLR